MSSLRILVVDDDKDFAESLGDVLGLNDYDVELAYSGEEALDRFGRRNFDVTFMEAKLPGKNGIESFLEMRKAKPEMKCIIMTGYGMDRLLKKARENGVWAILQKPLNVKKILEMLKGIRPIGPY
jgi:DNA-binding NtrC family response regulator